MSEFIVSARKYRPATFASVVGQQSITSTLKNAIERGQLAHAYLFCGPRGVGKTTCARIFAKAINCLNPNGAEACNECESCRAFNEGRSMNIHELDAASNNSVDDIRSLIEQVRIMPQVGKYSLFIIDEVHMLSPQAFNAFLKTLEEPPKHAVFILATTEKHKIIPTILSRCQIYDFNRIRVEDSVEYLRYIAQQEGVSFDEESLNLIAQKADGGMRDALSMFDKAVSFCNSQLQYKQVAQTLNVLDYDTYFTMTDLLLEGDYISALLRFDEVLAKGFSGQTFMAGLNQHLRDLLLAKGPAIKLIELTGSLLERYKSQAERCESQFLFGAISLLTEADGKIKQSSNQRLLVELGLMKIASLGKKKNDDLPIIDFFELPDLPAEFTPIGNNHIASPSPANRAATAGTTATTAVNPTATQVNPSTQPTQPSPSESSPKAPEHREGAETTGAERRGPVSDGAVSGGAEKRSAASEGAEKSGAESGGTKREEYSHRSTMTGLSISSLLNSATRPQGEPLSEECAKEEGQNLAIDPQSEEKILALKQSIIAKILEERPRFIVAFEKMSVEGHVIKVAVPTPTLYEEIMRSRTEILLLIARMTGINGYLDLEVTVNEEKRAARPIKLEDRVTFMLNKNPHLAELKRLLDLEYE